MNVYSFCSTPFSYTEAAAGRRTEGGPYVCFARLYIFHSCCKLIL